MCPRSSVCYTSLTNTVVLHWDECTLNVLRRNQPLKIKTKPMSKFMIYNADEVTFILKKTLDEARQWAIMYCDHSDEIIVREISNIEYKY